jgi:hypothetical protein
LLPSRSALGELEIMPRDPFVLFAKTYIEARKVLVLGSGDGHQSLAAFRPIQKR